MDSCYEYYTLLMDNILSCFILSYILIYFYRLLYTLLYAFLYSLLYTLICYTLLYTAPHILHHPYILFYYILFYAYYYILLYILSTLLFSNSIINFAPAVLYLFPLIPLLSLIYLPLLFSYTLYSHIVIPTLLYRKGITTLPPIFTRFTSLS